MSSTPPFAGHKGLTVSLKLCLNPYIDLLAILPKYPNRVIFSYIIIRKVQYSVIEAPITFVYNRKFCKTYCKSFIKTPGGGLFNFGHSRGGLKREGGLLERGAYSLNQMTRMYTI